jgi:glyoxylase-like metal-dependent hydrolase (beta-lactamase superfamily II)
VLVTSFAAQMFGTNCYVLAAGPGEQCLVVDPGILVMDQLEEVLAEYRLHPAAVLLTHGHLDHTFSVAPVCGARGITAYVHPADRAMLADPTIGLSTDLRGLLRGGPLTYSAPEDVAELPDAGTITVAGLRLTVDHAPGHTEGSVLFRFDSDAGQVDSDEICLSGDVLFAGSIGRTDLPGGSMDRMTESLRTKILVLDDTTLVLPGHGPATTIGRERVRNPYLRDLIELEPGGKVS